MREQCNFISVMTDGGSGEGFMNVSSRNSIVGNLHHSPSTVLPHRIPGGKLRGNNKRVGFW